MRSKNQDSPMETKLFGGISYSVDIHPGTTHVSVYIGQGEHAIVEQVECPDVSPDDHEELFRQGHQFAQRYIQNEGELQLAKLFGIP